MISLVTFARLDASPAPGHAAVATATAAPVSGAALWLLAAIAPFEVPLLSLHSGLTVTSVEIALLVAVLVTFPAIVYAGRPLVWRTPLTLPMIACLVVAAVAALLSPVDRGNAARFALRLAAAVAVFATVVNLVTTRERARALVRVLVATGVVVAVIAVLEAAQVRSVLKGLTLFRPGFHVVGGQLRATSTMIYPTIASMYLEVAFALGLWLLTDRPAGSSRRSGMASLAALATIAAGIIATFTRAGLLGMAAVLVLVGILHYAKTRRIDVTHARLAARAAVIAGFILASRSPDVLLTRLRTEGSQDWYGASYTAPATLALTTGGEYQIPVTIENRGRVVWDSTIAPMFAMSYHWLRADSEAVVQFDGWRTLFDAPVEPGGRVTMPVNVRAPGEPGRYILVWDVVHEHRAWLSTEGVPSARSQVTVDGPRVGDATAMMPRLPRANVRADRLTLWRAALRMARSRPVLGVGPDNFRKVYGGYVGLTAWDTRVHANNMYLEALAGAGLLGLGALLWLMAAGARHLWARWRHAPASLAPALAALCAAWVMVAGHGLVDSFFAFTSTYVMFAIAAGLACSPGLAAE